MKGKVLLNTERLNSTVSQKTLSSKGLQEERNPNLSSIIQTIKGIQCVWWNTVHQVRLSRASSLSLKGVKAFRFTQGLYHWMCMCEHACMFLGADSSSQRALGLLWRLPLVPLCGLNMSRDITFIMGQSEIRLSGGVLSRLEQTSHILFNTTPTQN